MPIATHGGLILRVRHDELVLVGSHELQLVLRVHLQLHVLGLELSELRGRGERWVGQGGGQALIVLLQGVLSVVQHQVLQALVDVVRLGETVAPLGGVYYAVLHRAVAPANAQYD